MKKLLILLVLVALGLVIYQALTFYDNRFPFGRMRETPAVKPHEIPMLKMDPHVVPVTAGDKLLQATPDRSLLPPPEFNSSQSIAKGKIIYNTYCVHCHGSNFDGEGTVGQSFAPLPGDLRSARVQELAPGTLFKEISFGIPGGRQPALATTISVEDRWRVTAFVHSLASRP